MASILPVNVGPQGHSIGLHLLHRTEDEFNLTWLIQIIYLPLLLTEEGYVPWQPSPVHCYRGMYQTDSCRGGPAL